MRTRRLLPLLALVAVLVATLPLSSASAGKSTPGRSYAHLQMNLCLSGLAGCFAGTEYPGVVDEAVVTIRRVRPASVVIDEACSGDAASIARRTGMHVSFANVIYGGAELPCRDPDGRGFFGNAVLTSSAPVQVESQAYVSQYGQEERRWICVTGRDQVTVCGTHLAVGGAAGSPNQANQDAQCVEFGQVLQRLAAQHTVIASGDMNRQTSCAPAGFWTLRDEDATQAKGIQHVYGEVDAFVRTTKRIVPATYTDHDFLLVKATVRPGG